MGTQVEVQADDRTGVRLDAGKSVELTALEETEGTLLDQPIEVLFQGLAFGGVERNSH